MSESVFLNLGSLVFGMAAWILPAIGIAQHHKIPHRRFAVLVAASFAACAAALCLQIFEMNHRINVKDWAALMDTAHAVALIALILLVVTIVLNAVAITLHFKSNRESA